MKIRLVVFVVGLAIPALAQMQNNTTPQLRCDDNNRNGRRVRHCEMREQTVPYTGQLTVDGRTNGGISVRGWTRADVLVRMKVEAWGADDAEARSIASGVRVDLGAGSIAGNGPQLSGDTGWSISYEIFAPHQANLNLTVHNGGVHVSDVRGNIEFAAVNGGIHLNRVAGRVKGQTTNGGVHVQLAGDRWDGEGLEVTTTNGGVHLNVPENYSARLEASTVNGGLRANYPMALTAGETGKRLAANLGSGGATLRFTTTNGGVHVNRN